MLEYDIRAGDKFMEKVINIQAIPKAMIGKLLRNLEIEKIISPIKHIPIMVSGGCRRSFDKG